MLIPYRKEKAAHAAAGRAMWNHAKAGEEYILRMYVNKPTRSIGQNRMFHAVLGIYANYTGRLMDDMKIEFKKEYFFEWRKDKQGKEYKHLKETSKADTEEMTAAITKLLIWGRELWPECVVPDPRNITYMQLMQIEDDYEKEFKSGW
jgi:hypothetical protein